MKEEQEPPEPKDAELFRQAVGGVTPLSPSGRVTLAKPEPVSPKPAAAGAGASGLSGTDVWTDHGAGGEALTEFLRNGVSRMTLRKLRRGQFPAQNSLDLHGLASDAARSLLQQFLRESLLQGLRSVRIIHGKGLHGRTGEGILRIRARHWLTQCPEVLAFCEAPPAQGGGGAVLVLLKVAHPSAEGQRKPS